MRVILLILGIIYLAAACRQTSPQIKLPEEMIVGEELLPTITGLEPGMPYAVQAIKKDQLKRDWQSEAYFTADDQGKIDLRVATPDSGSYSQAEAGGLLYSMAMPNPPGKDWKAPLPRDFAKLQFLLRQNGDSLTSVSAKQWIIPPTVEKETLDGPLVAEIMYPQDRQVAMPGILLLGGSGGGNAWARRMGAVLATQGYVTMALAYFNAGELPQHLAQLPLEYIDTAIDALLSRADVNGTLALVGYSKGAELALLMASRRQDVSAVVAFAPGSAVFQGFKPPKYPVISSWTLNGKDLPFVPNAYDKKFFETYDGMYLWYRTLAQHEAFDQAAIKVEEINGPILLFSGVQDRIWPATFMAEQIVARLHVNDFSHTYVHHAFSNAGHGIAEPPGHPTTRLSQSLGGTPQGNHQARKESWEILKTFLQAHLNED